MRTHHVYEVNGASVVKMKYVFVGVRRTRLELRAWRKRGQRRRRYSARAREKIFLKFSQVMREIPLRVQRAESKTQRRRLIFSFYYLALKRQFFKCIELNEILFGQSQCDGRNDCS